MAGFEVLITIAALAEIFVTFGALVRLKHNQKLVSKLDRKKSSLPLIQNEFSAKNYYCYSNVFENNFSKLTK